MATALEELIAALPESLVARIVDVGANPIGEDAPYRRAVDASLAHVVGFEPQPEALQSLLDQRGPNETYLPHAVGDGRPMRLRIYSGSGFASRFDVDRGTASLLGKFLRYVRKTDEITMDTVSLDDCREIPPIDFLKIDVQGSELDILRHGRRKLAQAVAIQTEVRFFPLYEGEPRFGELESELCAQGFLMHDLRPPKRFPLGTSGLDRLKRRQFRQVIDTDAVYLRDLRTLPSWTDRQVAVLALLGLSVIGSPDAAVLAADDLARRGLIGAPLVDRLITEIRRGLYD